MPLDLSLIAKARANGPDYLYSLLLGYEDALSGKDVPDGMHYNNAYSGNLIAMPQPIYGDDVEYADGADTSTSADVTNFLMCRRAEARDPQERRRRGVLPVDLPGDVLLRQAPRLGRPALRIGSRLAANSVRQNKTPGICRGFFYGRMNDADGDGGLAADPVEKGEGALPCRFGGVGVELAARIAIEAVVGIIDMGNDSRVGVGLCLDEGVHAVHRNGLVAFAEMRQHGAMGDKPGLRRQLASIIGHCAGDAVQAGRGTPGK